MRDLDKGVKTISSNLGVRLLQELKGRTYRNLGLNSLVPARPPDETSLLKIREKEETRASREDPLVCARSKNQSRE